MTRAPGSVRCFVAVELPDEVKSALRGLQEMVRERIRDALGASAERGLGWVIPEGIHLTLKFLGNVPAAKIAPIGDALLRSLDNAQACTISVTDLGMFPNRHRPRVLWVGVSGDLVELSSLQRLVEVATVPLGFPTEQRPFSPHLTLARVREQLTPTDRRDLGATIAAARLDSRLVVPVREISLIRSELSPGGARYSLLMSAPLRSENRP